MENNNLEEKETKVVKGVNPIVVIFLSLILVVGCGFGGWYLGTQYADKEDKKNDTKVEETNKKDETSKEENKDENKPAKNSNYTFVKERIEEVNYTNEKTENIFNVVAYYYVDKENLENSEEIKEDYYVVRREVFVNGKAITNVLTLDIAESENAANKVITEDNLSSHKPLKDLKNDNAYLVINLEDKEGIVNNGLIGFMDYDSCDSYIVDKTGVTLKTMNVYNFITGITGIFVNKDEVGDRTSYSFEEAYGEDADVNTFYENYNLTEEDVQYSIYAKNNCVDIHDSYIYYIDLEDCQDVKEYKLTVSNGVVSSKNVKSYSGNKVQGAGQC